MIKPLTAEEAQEEIEMIQTKDSKSTIVDGKTITRKGGFRPNAGRPRGSKNKLTKDAKVREKTIKERILKNADELLNAQLQLAKGVNFLYEIRMRNVAGRRKAEHILVTDPKKIKAFMDGDLEEQYFYVSAQAPDNRAIDSLLNRAFGKATTEANVNHDYQVNIVNYGQIASGEEGRSENNYRPAQIFTEGVSAGTATSSPEIQDSGMEPSFRKIENSSEPAN